MDADTGDRLEDGQSGIHPALASTLAARGYDMLTPVQQAVLDHSDADLLVSAQTGSGKTVAFGIAIARTLLGSEPNFGPPGHPLALVIAPTRELALQVQRELDWLYAEAGLRSASSVGGMDVRTERRALERGAHLVVGTPGRLRDHISKQALDLSVIRAVVLDEADEMLDLGFREDLEFILQAIPAERRILMFSATVPPAIEHLAKTFQREAVRVTATERSERHADIEYQMLVVQPEEREHAIVNALLFFDSRNSLVFCHTREAVKHLTARLANRGFAVVTLSGELSQAERTSALQSMRDGRARVCVATDVAARGLDLPNLDLVIHADLPSKPDTLLHRSGRTGRAGRKGTCVLVVPLHRRASALRVLKLANVVAETRQAPTAAEIDDHYRRQILEAATAAAALDDDEKSAAAELLATVSAEQLAALYLRQQRALRPVPEDISPVAVTALQGRHTGTIADGREGPRERKPDMQGGVWFTVSLGRKQRADPKWLLPMICKAGGVTKGAVGSIRIGETETRFEISGDKAATFLQHLARGGGEKGLAFAPVDGGTASADASLRPSDKPRGRSGQVADSPKRSRPAVAKQQRPEASPQKRTKPKSGGRSGPTDRVQGWDPAGQQPRKRGPKRP